MYYLLLLNKKRCLHLNSDYNSNTARILTEMMKKIKQGDIRNSSYKTLDHFGVFIYKETIRENMVERAFLHSKKLAELYVTGKQK